MSQPTPPVGLQISQDLDHQRLAWRLQRVGWIGMALALLAAIAGWTGQGGPFCHASTGDSARGIGIDYSRTARLQAPDTLEIRLDRRHSRDGKLTLWIDRDWLRNQRIQMITPDPKSQTISADRIDFTFRASPAGGDLIVTFSIEPQTWGSCRGTIGVAGSPGVSFKQFVLP